LREFVEEREKTVPQETREILMTGLEQRPYTVEDVHKFYDDMRENPKYKISIDLSRSNNKDILYVALFRPSQEYLEENIDNEMLKDRFFCKFGVSGEVIERSEKHLNDDAFTDYTVLKNFTYHNSSGRSLAELRIKTILKNMNLRIDYYNKKEIFVCTEEELDTIYEHMEIHNNEMNKEFEEQFNNNFELEKIKLQNQKEIEINTICMDKKIELKLKIIPHFIDLFERGKITFEQLKEITSI
jgi:hypothetical protein